MDASVIVVFVFLEDSLWFPLENGIRERTVRWKNFQSATGARRRIARFPLECGLYRSYSTTERTTYAARLIMLKFIWRVLPLLQLFFTVLILPWVSIFLFSILERFILYWFYQFIFMYYNFFCVKVGPSKIVK